MEYGAHTIHAPVLPPAHQHVCAREPLDGPSLLLRTTVNEGYVRAPPAHRHVCARALLDDPSLLLRATVNEGYVRVLCVVRFESSIPLMDTQHAFNGRVSSPLLIYKLCGHKLYAWSKPEGKHRKQRE